MNILYISNQVSIDNVGNPIITNLINEINNRTDHCAHLIGFKFNMQTIEKLLLARKKNYDIIHIQFGGFYAFVAILFFIGKKRPLKLITFHGTDIHGILTKMNSNFLKKMKVKINRFFSIISFPFFDKIGFVSSSLENCISIVVSNIFQKKMFIQQLGVDYKMFNPILSQKQAKDILSLKTEKKYFLFSSISTSPVKRYDKAAKIVELLGEEYEILLLSNVPVKDVPLYLGSADFVIITSDAEGSPNIVREALAMNKPIFSVDVGDVKEQIYNCKNCLIIDKNPQIASFQIKEKIDKIQFEDTRNSMKDKISLYNTTKDLLKKYYK